MHPAEKFVPNYFRLESHLRESIRNGDLKPGNPIPPESHLCQQYSVSRTTVRQALSRLVYDGLIERHRGRGSFVAEPRLEHSKPFLSFEEEMLARCRGPRSWPVLVRVVLLLRVRGRDAPQGPHRGGGLRGAPLPTVAARRGGPGPPERPDRPGGAGEGGAGSGAVIIHLQASGHQPAAGIPRPVAADRRRIDDISDFGKLFLDSLRVWRNPALAEAEPEAVTANRTQQGA